MICEDVKPDSPKFFKNIDQSWKINSFSHRIVGLYFRKMVQIKLVAIKEVNLTLLHYF